MVKVIADLSKGAISTQPLSPADVTAYNTITASIQAAKQAADAAAQAEATIAAQVAADQTIIRTWATSGNTVLPLAIAQALARLVGAV